MKSEYQTPLSRPSILAGVEGAGAPDAICNIQESDGSVDNVQSPLIYQGLHSKCGQNVEKKARGLQCWL